MRQNDISLHVPLFVLLQFMNQYWIKIKIHFCGENFEQYK